MRNGTSTSRARWKIRRALLVWGRFSMFEQQDARGNGDVEGVRAFGHGNRDGLVDAFLEFRVNAEGFIAEQKGDTAFLSDFVEWRTPELCGENADTPLPQVPDQRGEIFVPKDGKTKYGPARGANNFRIVEFDGFGRQENGARSGGFGGADNQAEVVGVAQPVEEKEWAARVQGPIPVSRQESYYAQHAFGILMFAHIFDRATVCLLDDNVPACRLAVELLQASVDLEGVPVEDQLLERRV